MISSTRLPTPHKTLRMTSGNARAVRSTRLLICDNWTAPRRPTARSLPEGPLCRKPQDCNSGKDRNVEQQLEKRGPGLCPAPKSEYQLGGKIPSVVSLASTSAQTGANRWNRPRLHHRRLGAKRWHEHGGDIGRADHTQMNHPLIVARMPFVTPQAVVGAVLVGSSGRSSEIWGTSCSSSPQAMRCGDEEASTVAA